MKEGEPKIGSAELQDQKERRIMGQSSNHQEEDKLETKLPLLGRERAG